MKDQAFGVELELKGLDCEGAARAGALALGGTAVGTRVTDPATGKVWKAVRDGSLHGTSAEVVTPILMYNEIPKLQEVVRALRRAGARVDSQCGIHCHIDASRHDAKSLARLIKLVNSKEGLLFKALQVNEARLARYAKKIDQQFLNRLVRNAPRNLQQLNRAWYGHENRRPAHYHRSRYQAINLHAVFEKGTVEFRLFNSSLHAGKVKAYVQLCFALSHKALTGRAARHRPTRTTNEKFTFRVWLVGLGLKGPECKTARLHLTANLSGNSAWRNGPPATRRQRPEVETLVPAVTGSERSTVYLENRSDGHLKFYRIEWNGCLKVRTIWGRIGSEGRAKEERFENDATFRAYVESTLRTRLGHGYSVISDSRMGR